MVLETEILRRYCPLELAGFALEDRSADWTGAPFTAESGSHVSVYRLATR